MQVTQQLTGGLACNAGGARRLSVSESFAVNSFDERNITPSAAEGSAPSTRLSRALESIPESEDEGRETVGDVAEATVSSLRQPHADTSSDSSNQSSAASSELDRHDTLDRSETSEREAELDEGWIGWAKGWLPWGGSKKTEEHAESAAKPAEVRLRSTPPQYVTSAHC